MQDGNDQDEWLEKAKQRFDFDSWPRPLALDADGTRPAVRGLALMLASETDSWVFERRAAHDNGYTDFFHVAGQPEERALVDVYECPTHEVARRTLLDLLSKMMAITLPRLEDGRIGEVAFIGHEHQTDAVTFVRLNIVVHVRSIAREPVDVLSLAALADGQIRDQAFTTSTGRAATMTELAQVNLTGTAYNDLYIRDSFGDSGIVPSTGDACQSPDIIPVQAGTLSWATANSTYAGPDQGKSIINGGVNNIYVRAKNLNTAAGSGTAGLYYANASLFLRPSTWTAISAAGGASSVSLVDGSGNTSIAAGSVAISSPAFLLTGLPPGPHYCTIAVLQTPSHPVTVPATFPSNAAFVQWVQNNPAVGWRNISYAPNQQTQVVRTYAFASVNADAAYFHFRILGKGFATGTPVNAQCSDQTCPINQNMTLPAPDSQGNQITGFDASVPGNFTGTLVLTLTSPGGAFPPGATVTMTYYQYPSLADELDMTVARVTRTVHHSTVGAIETAPMLIQIGECTITMVAGLSEEVEG